MLEDATSRRLNMVGLYSSFLIRILGILRKMGHLVSHLHKGMFFILRMINTKYFLLIDHNVLYLSAIVTRLLEELYLRVSVIVVVYDFVTAKRDA